MLYHSIFCIALLMYLFVLCAASLTVFGETIRNMFGCGLVFLLLNVMEVFSVGGGALLDRPCMFSQKMGVLCM